MVGIPWGQVPIFDIWCVTVFSVHCENAELRCPIGATEHSGGKIAAEPRRGFVLQPGVEPRRRTYPGCRVPHRVQPQRGCVGRRVDGADVDATPLALGIYR